MWKPQTRTGVENINVWPSQDSSFTSPRAFGTQRDPNSLPPPPRGSSVSKRKETTQLQSPRSAFTEYVGTGFRPPPRKPPTSSAFEHRRVIIPKYNAIDPKKDAFKSEDRSMYIEQNVRHLTDAARMRRRFQSRVLFQEKENPDDTSFYDDLKEFFSQVGSEKNSANSANPANPANSVNSRFFDTMSSFQGNYKFTKEEKNVLRRIISNNRYDEDYFVTWLSENLGNDKAQRFYSKLCSLKDETINSYTSQILIRVGELISSCHDTDWVEIIIPIMKEYLTEEERYPDFVETCNVYDGSDQSKFYILDSFINMIDGQIDNELIGDQFALLQLGGGGGSRHNKKPAVSRKSKRKRKMGKKKTWRRRSIC